MRCPKNVRIELWQEDVSIRYVFVRELERICVVDCAYLVMVSKVIISLGSEKRAAT